MKHCLIHDLTFVFHANSFMVSISLRLSKNTPEHVFYIFLKRMFPHFAKYM